MFDLEKINKIEISTNENGKIHKVLEKLKYFGNNPETILDYDINDSRKEEIAFKLYALIIILIKIIEKEEIKEYLDIDKNYIKEYISKTLIKYKKFFDKSNIKLENQIILKVVENLNYFEECDFLKYCNSITDVLKILCDDKFSSFLKKCQSYRDYLYISIDIEKKVKPQINDNLKEILDLYSKIKNNSRLQAIHLKFNSSFFKYYIDAFENKNIDNLYDIKNIIDSIPSLCYSGSKPNISQIIYETGIFLAEKKALNNEQILKLINLIKNDGHEKLEIIKYFDIKSFNDKFYKEFDNVFSSISLNSNISKYLIDLIKDLKDFNILYKLLKYQLDNGKIRLIQDKFIDLINNNPKNIMEFFEDFILLLSYSITFGSGFDKLIEDFKNVPELKEDIKVFLTDLLNGFKNFEAFNERRYNFGMCGMGVEGCLYSDEYRIYNNNKLFFLIVNYYKLIEKQRKKKEKEVEFNYKIQLNEELIKLKKELNELKTELEKEKTKNNNLEKKIEQLNDEYNDIIKKKEEEIFKFKLTEKEKFIPISIISSDEDIYYCTICRKTDELNRVVQKFYEENPELEYKGYFKINNKRIDLDKTIEENKINNNKNRIIIYHKN